MLWWRSKREELTKRRLAVSCQMLCSAWSQSYARFNDPSMDNVEMMPLRSTSSQELEWDPTGAQLAIDDMNPEETEKSGDGESYDEDMPLPQLKNQYAPLASASEVTINRLSQTFPGMS